MQTSASEFEDLIKCINFGIEVKIDVAVKKWRVIYLLQNYCVENK